MILRALLTVFLALTAFSCGPRYVDYFPYHDDGTCKPCVAFLPVKDCSNTQCPWNISEELTQGFRYKIRDNAELYLLSSNKVFDNMKKAGDVDYFSNDISYAKEYSNCEFLVAMELIEHKLVPYEKGTISPLYTIHCHKCNYVLMMSMRVKIIDIRGDKPCVILQEIIRSNHMVSKEYDGFDYNREPWGSGGYCRTPYGLAHQRMISDVVTRIENATWMAR